MLRRTKNNNTRWLVGGERRITWVAPRSPLPFRRHSSVWNAALDHKHLNLLSGSVHQWVSIERRVPPASIGNDEYTTLELDEYEDVIRKGWRNQGLGN